MMMNRKSAVHLFCSLIVLMGFTVLSSLNSQAIEPPDRLYSVQVGDRDLAHLKGELESHGWGPFSLDAEAEGGRLLLGQAEYYIDALLCALQIQSAYGIPVEVVEMENLEGMALQQIDGPIQKIFHMPEADMNEVPNVSLPLEDPLVSNLKSLEMGSDKTAYRRALMDAIYSLPDEDVRKGFALTRKGIFELVEGNYEQALANLKPVSNGEVTARRLDRIKAMRRVAWILHQQDKKLEAYQAYREMQAFSGSNYSKTQAAVECAGLLMELARDDKGTLEQCRRECLKVLEMSEANKEDPDYRQLRATAELMFFETFYYGKQYEIAANLAEDFIQKYPDRPRELSMALLFKGCTLRNLGEYPQAKAALVQILETEWPENPHESWGSGGQRWDMKSRAAGFLYRYAKDFDDQEGMALAESYTN